MEAWGEIRSRCADANGDPVVLTDGSSCVAPATCVVDTAGTGCVSEFCAFADGACTPIADAATCAAAGSCTDAALLTKAACDAASNPAQTWTSAQSDVASCTLAKCNYNSGGQLIDDSDAAAQQACADAGGTWAELEPQMTAPTWYKPRFSVGASANGLPDGDLQFAYRCVPL
jgi:hypothetical protein